jgi:hypothetical protein
MKDWPAMHKWSPDFFKALAPNKPFYIEEGNIFQNTTRFRAIRFDEYIDSIFYDRGLSKDEQPSYLADFDILGLCDSLPNDLDFSLIKAHSLHTRVNGWIGPAGTVASFHIDWADNLFAQIHGSKLIKLISPKFNANMYPNKKFDAGSLLSSVDVDNYSPEEYPLFQEVEIHYTTLGPGEMLYIPYGWWHYLRALEPSVSVNCFGWNLKSLCIDLQMTKLKKLLHRFNLYGSNGCTCHMIKDGKRVRRPMHY